jgi:CheY-like chemotaxis protein
MMDAPLTPDRIRVLVVDDEHSIADTLSVILKQQGFETATAYCGATAVQAALLWSPDVLLSDVVMPGMNGIEAALRIRASNPQCKLLLFSGHNLSEESLSACRSLGERNFRFLQKPLHPDALIEALRALLTTDTPATPLEPAL